MTDSMNFGPDWIRNLSSEGTTTGGVSGGARCQLADYRYGREEMLSFFDKNLKPPQSLLGFKGLYSEVTLPPLALSPVADEEQRVWTGRPISINGPPRGRGGPMERGGRVSRGGRGGYQNYGRPTSYEGNWGNGGEQTEWSPRKEYNSRSSNDNWRRNRLNEEDEGWRNLSHNKPVHEKWVRSSWRSGDGEPEDRGERQIGGPEGRGNRIGWSEGSRGNAGRRSWDTEDHLPEWVMENVDGGGTFDSSGAFHHSDEEQGDPKPTAKKEAVLQKSSSQQHITTSKGYFSSLQTSKSVASLSKPDTNYNMKEKSYDSKKAEEENQETESTDRTRHSQQSKIRSEQEHTERERKETSQQKPPEREGNTRKVDPAAISNTVNHKDTRVEDDYKIQEDIILKLVDEDNAPKAGLGVVKAENVPTVTPSTLQPPPNLGPPMQDHWFYQDPQGQMQGPFSSAEMAEWYKAGYFNNQLKVRRPCDELFYLLGELVALCEGANPFQVVATRFPPLKPDPTTLAEHDLLQYQYLMALKQTRAAAAMPEPWSTLTLQQQQEVAAQRLIMHPQVSQELPFIHQSNSSNPLMQMINQMQQANKLPNASIGDATPSALPGQLDPRLVTLSLQHQLQQQSRLPPTSAGMLPNPLASRLPGVTTDGLNLPGMMQRPIGIPTPSIGASALANAMNMQRPLHAPVVDNMGSKVVEDPIRSLLNQLQQKPSGISLDLWQSSQYPIPTTLPSQQWQHETPLSMWDITKPPEVPPQQPELPPTVLTSQQIENAMIPKPSHEQEHQPHPPQQKSVEKKTEPSISPKELRKKKELEEKQAKKEAEERRKNEQRKLEAEKREAEEKKKKEEERIRKEIEKAKKEAEDKRMKELEEKRRLKEQRKAEEEAKRMTEEQKKAEEERAKKEAREREEYARREAARQAQEQAARNAKTAPWCHSSSTQGLTLQEIQKLEKEKAKQEAVILQQQKQMMEFQQQQLEKSAAGFSWANKAKEPKQVKSLSEIQAEEQERMAKQATEARLLALQKEKELPTPVQNMGNIWSSQNISWSANGVNSSQWSSSNSTGLWEDAPAKATITKPSINSKGNTAASGKSQNSQQQQQQSQKSKTKTKKEDTNISKNSSADDFTNWCSKALANITSEIDIPTFVTFLRDIESALDVREYCKEYLGDNAEAQQFASNFLDKRRSFRPKSQVPKDDMCSPAPAITPSSIHSNDFQEVKGKNKKNKKNKMLKVDSRILGFNVTSAPDRINALD
ncbi:hypothetical protein WA026_009449 [Henosepilachna vigintioctopunctata]|uniref:GYF domain-containing protein n=1 Tax=Henosepilachna vigintioctopunctata TaxID=420089 RepID=A0AAW1TVQ7_9CUCU